MVGRPRFEPALIEQATVAAMAAYGIEQSGIVRVILRPSGKTKTLKPISVKTLRRYFRVELDSGLDQANAKVAEALYKRAVDLLNTKRAKK